MYLKVIFLVIASTVGMSEGSKVSEDLVAAGAAVKDESEAVNPNDMEGEDMFGSVWLRVVWCIAFTFCSWAMFYGSQFTSKHSALACVGK